MVPNRWNHNSINHIYEKITWFWLVDQCNYCVISCNYNLKANKPSKRQNFYDDGSMNCPCTHELSKANKPMLRERVIHFRSSQRGGLRNLLPIMAIGSCHFKLQLWNSHISLPLLISDKSPTLYNLVLCPTWQSQMLHSLQIWTNNEKTNCYQI